MIRVREATLEQLVAFARGLADENPARRPVEIYERTGFPSLDTALRVLIARAVRHQRWRKTARQKRPAEARKATEAANGSTADAVDSERCM